jgi:thioredoxin reductase (NADPH)
VVREGGEVLAISRERLKEVVTEEPNLSDIILKAFLARRSWGMRTGLGLRIIGSRHSRDATRLREFAARNRLPTRLDRARGGPRGRSLARAVRREAL